MTSWMPEWLKLAGPGIGWMLLGAVLVLVVLWCRRQYGIEVALRMYWRSFAEKPADREAVERLFAGSKVTLIGASESTAHVRYRFTGGAEIDVMFDRANGRIIWTNPTFAKDGIGWLTRLLHRGQFFTVPVTIPSEEKTEEGDPEGG